VETLSDQEDTPVSVAVDDAYAYWTAVGPLGDAEGLVRRVPKSGGMPETLYAHRDHPYSVAVDGDHVYWTDNYSGIVARGAADGSSILPLAGGQWGLFRATVRGPDVYFLTALSGPYGALRRVPK
jgi:hypothetical protein